MEGHVDRTPQTFGNNRLATIEPPPLHAHLETAGIRSSLVKPIASSIDSLATAELLVLSPSYFGRFASIALFLCPPGAKHTLSELWMGDFAGSRQQDGNSPTHWHAILNSGASAIRKFSSQSHYLQ